MVACVLAIICYRLFPKVDEDRFESPIMIVHLTNNRLSSLPKNLCLD